jgi:hypothetical protein
MEALVLFAALLYGLCAGARRAINIGLWVLFTVYLGGLYINTREAVNIGIWAGWVA